jgi:hypothetical protein
MPLVLQIGIKNGAWWKGLLAAAAGGAFTVAQHWLVDGSIPLDLAHLKIMLGGSAFAVIAYFAKSPFHDGYTPDAAPPIADPAGKQG